jgi:L-methionine (R)-S-oxide reductase
VYDTMLDMAGGLMEGRPHPLSAAANLAALMFQEIAHLNWAGFYFLHEGALLLGPFQGKPACLRIEIERGVCGAAVRQGRTLLVPDVQAFAGHIACDAQSRSELVCPIRAGGRIVGVIDLDSPQPGRFTEAERQAVESLAALYAARCDLAGPVGYFLA